MQEMNVTEKDMYDFMDSGRDVRVTCTDGYILIGRCWAYGAEVSKDEFGEDEPCIDVGCSTIIPLSQIESIEYVDNQHNSMTEA